jgi:hypothetical protein
MAEALLPGTYAITDNTLEWTEYRGKWLVRYKTGSGSIQRVLTASWDAANVAFEKYLAEMRAAAGHQKTKNTSEF